MQKIVEIFKTVAFPKSNDAAEEQCMDQEPVQSKETCVDDTKSKELKLLEETIYDVIRDVHDPEKPENLEELNVVTEDCVTVSTLNGGQLIVRVEFSPTVPHCSLAALIGLSLRKKMERCLPESEKYKIDIFIKEGKHETANEINKQINDKERIAAAMENPNLRELIEKCIAESEDTY